MLPLGINIIRKKKPVAAELVCYVRQLKESH